MLRHCTRLLFFEEERDFFKNGRSGNAFFRTKIKSSPLSHHVPCFSSSFTSLVALLSWKLSFSSSDNYLDETLDEDLALARGHCRVFNMSSFLNSVFSASSPADDADTIESIMKRSWAAYDTYPLTKRAEAAPQYRQAITSPILSTSN